MTFTRFSDAATLEPGSVFGPFETDREVRNISRELLHSRETRNTFVPSTYRQGYFQLIFDTHSEARSAAAWFSEDSRYSYSGPEEVVGEGWEIVDDIIVEVEPTIDTSFDTTFIVWGGGLTTIQTTTSHWALRVPYKEVS